VLEGGAAVGTVLRLPMLPEFEPSFISGLEGEQGHLIQLLKGLKCTQIRLFFNHIGLRKYAGRSK
jgi:hypothetical protein